MKKLIISLLLIIILVAGFTYYYTTANNTIEANDSSPLNANSIVQDSLDQMTKEERENFELQTELAQVDNNEMEDDMPGKATILAQGDFHPRVHSVQGQALLIEEGSKKILRFEDFETDNGPRLHIYLSSDLGDDDFIDLGEIKATKGNVNYELPDNIDTTKYNKVLVWCVPFKVLFSYAEIK
jgi:hypothetical protein